MYITAGVGRNDRGRLARELNERLTSSRCSLCAGVCIVCEKKGNHLGMAAMRSLVEWSASSLVLHRYVCVLLRHQLFDACQVPFLCCAMQPCIPKCGDCLINRRDLGAFGRRGRSSAAAFLFLCFSFLFRCFSRRFRFWCGFATTPAPLAPLFAGFHNVCCLAFGMVDWTQDAKIQRCRFATLKQCRQLVIQCGRFHCPCKRPPLQSTHTLQVDGVAVFPEGRLATQHWRQQWITWIGKLFPSSI